MHKRSTFLSECVPTSKGIHVHKLSQDELLKMLNSTEEKHMIDSNYSLSLCVKKEHQIH